MVVLDDVVVALVAAEVRRREALVRALVDPVEAPVQPVYIQVDVAPVRAVAAQGVLEVRDVLVPRVLGVGALPVGRCAAVVGPALVQPGVQDERIVRIGGLPAEDRVVQLGRPPGPLERYLHGELVGLPAVRAGAALDFHAGIYLEILRAVGVYQFHRRAAFDALALQVDSPAVAEPVLHRHDEREARDGLHVVSDGLRVCRDDLRVHLVVGLGLAPGGLPPPAPVVGEVVAGLGQDVIEKYVGLRIDVGGDPAGLEGGRAEYGLAGDVDGAGVD